MTMLADIKSRMGPHGDLSSVVQTWDYAKKHLPDLQNQVQHDVEKLVQEVVQVGQMLGKLDACDCFVLFLTSRKEFPEDIARSLAKKLGVGLPKVVEPVRALAVELYDHMMANEVGKTVKVGEIGEIYLDCRIVREINHEDTEVGYE